MWLFCFWWCYTPWIQLKVTPFFHRTISKLERFDFSIVQQREVNGTSLEAFDLNPAVALFTIFLENLSNHRHRPRISSSSHNLHICHFSFFGCLMNFGRKSLQFQTFLNCQPPKKLKDQCLTYVQLDFHCILGNIWIIGNHRHIKKSYIIHHFGTHTSETDKSCTSNGHRSDAPQVQGWMIFHHQ